MSSLKVVWQDSAVDLLLDRDRYTRQSIRDGFRRNPRQEAMPFDPELHGFVTVVADKQYGVVWYQDDDRGWAFVRAVVPAANVPTQASALETYVDHVVKGLPTRNIAWDDNALNLLLDRDRHSSQAIRDEFQQNPMKGAIEFDPDHHGFVTFVANKRYSVVWYLDQERNQRVVRAVVPLTHITTDRPALKAYIERAVVAESKGAINLQSP